MLSPARPPPRERTRNRVTTAAAMAKLAALIATPMTGRPVSSSRPPMPGPTTTTRVCRAEKIEFAAARSCSPTISGVSAPAAGWYGASATDETAEMASTNATGAPLATATAIPPMRTALASAETTMTVVRW